MKKFRLTRIKLLVKKQGIKKGTVLEIDSDGFLYHGKFRFKEEWAQDLVKNRLAKPYGRYENETDKAGRNASC